MIETKIVSQIGQSCPDRASCRIRIRAITWFDWDKMYVFKYNATEADRERALGTRDRGFRELERQLVFTKGSTIVFQESEPKDIEGLVKNEVVFDIPDTASYKSYPPDAVFSVKEMRGKAGTYYELNQVQ